MNLGNTFAALRHPNFRLWFLGQLVSFVGSWMQTTAQGYLIYDLTHSSAYLGYVAFAGGVPVWVLSLYGGVLADRLPRRWLVFITQGTMMILALILSVLVFTRWIQPWHILVLAFLLGIANSFDAPGRQSFVYELVGKEDLTNAIALNASMFNMAVILGPTVGAMAYAYLGPGWCFFVNGISFTAVLAALLLMKLPHTLPRPRSGSITKEVMEGLRYAVKDEVLRTLFINLAAVCVFGFGVLTILPAWAVDVLGGDVRTNGLLLSARGAGALIGTLILANLAYRRIRGKMITIGSLFLPVTMLVFAFVRQLPLSMLAMASMGYCLIVMNNTVNGLVQTRSPDHLRGRVMSLFTLIIFGTNPIGGLFTGEVANRFGEVTAVVINSVVMALMAGYLLIRRPWLRKLE